MALAPAVGNLLSVQCIFTNVATATAMNILHYKVASISGPAPTNVVFLGTVAQDVAVAFGDVWKMTASDQVKFVNTRATNVFPLPRSVGVNYVYPAGGLAGTATSEALPLQDAITILKRTAVGNRWGLGRTFITGCPEDAQANGIITNAQRVFYNAVANFLGAPVAISGTGWSASIVPVLVRGPEDNPVSITDVLSGEVSNNIIKTQRRRRPGKGI